MKKNIILYGNGPSTNHGCEAIVRGIDAIGEDKISLNILSADVDSDYKYGLSKLKSVSQIISARTKNKVSLSFFWAWIKMKLTGNFLDLDAYYYESGIKNSQKISDVAFSIGGDNYCYTGNGFYSTLNKVFHRSGFKTVLFGVSVEPSVLSDSEMIKDMKNYDLIVARESITYNALKVINPHIYLVPDPAFFMNTTVNLNLKKSFGPKEFLGLNISPLILNCSRSKDTVYKSIINLIDHVLNSTNYNVILIPHVVKDQDDDRMVLNNIKNEFKINDRIILIEDCTAPELKGIISQCSLFIGARTHSVVAAYSSCIPTLALGYSVKAKGIAQDLFGSWQNYVLPVDNIKSEKQLIEAFDWLELNKDSIRENLKDAISGYKKAGLHNYEAIFNEIVNL